MRQRSLYIAALGVLSMAATAADFSAEYSRSEASRGFGAIDHVTLSVAGDLTSTVKGQLRVESKKQEGTGGNASKTGAFVEGIVSFPITRDWYGMTRVGFTDELALFVDRSIYQEFGYKFGKQGAVFVDGNVGVGTRKFPSGTEEFMNFGPTISWATGALWLRREQSLRGGGYRHVVSVAQWLNPALKLDAGIIAEKRQKYTLPVGGTALLSGVEAQRFSIGATYQVSQGVSVSLRGEKVSLEKEGTPGKYYDPSSVSLGLTVGF